MLLSKVTFDGQLVVWISKTQFRQSPVVSQV